jgi:DNA-binding response OmpR family regulator
MRTARPIDGNVLVVEPSSYYSSLLRDWLSDLGIRDVRFCSTVEKARRMVNEERYAALVIDSRLEDGSGIALAREIRHTVRCMNRMTPMVILDCRSTRRRVSAARDGGASEYVCKPMSRRSFSDHFRKAIHDRRNYIKAKGYFGPDRRRKSAEWHDGERRRQLPKQVPIAEGLTEA